MTFHKETNQRREQNGGVFNDKLQQSLKNLLNNSIRRQNPVSNSNRNKEMTLPHLGFIGEEGIDHINVSRYGSTELGKLLCMESPLTVEVPGLGGFASIAGLWYFLANPHDSKYIQLPGQAVYGYGKDCERPPKLEARSRVVVAYALWNLVKKYPDIRRALQQLPKETTFDCYLVKFRNKRPEPARLDYSTWYVYAINQIREAVVKGFPFPDFSRLSFLPKPLEDVRDAEAYKNMIEGFFDRAIYPAIDEAKRKAEAEAAAERALQAQLAETTPPIEGAPNDSVEDLNLAPPPAPPLVPTAEDLRKLNEAEQELNHQNAPQPVNEQAPQPINTAPQSLTSVSSVQETTEATSA